MSAGDALDRLARDAARFADEWPRDGADLIAERMVSALRADTGGDGRFSHVPDGCRRRRRHRRVRLRRRGRCRLQGCGRGWNTEPAVTSSRRPPGKALRTPYGPRARVKVSGMAAKRTWTSNVGRAVDAAADDARARLAESSGGDRWPTKNSPSA